MFHELTDSDIARRKRMRIIVACAIVAACIVVVALFSAMQANAKEQSAVAIRNAIMDSAKQCCAIEGNYPSSLEYLEQNYGLTINHDDYVISYESFAGNIMPTVVVTPR